MRNIKYGASVDEKELQSHLDEIRNAVWNAAATIVQDEFELINGIAGSLTSRVEQYNVAGGFSSDELSNLPVLKKP